MALKPASRESYAEMFRQYEAAENGGGSEGGASGQVPDAPPQLLNIDTITTLLDADLFRYEGVWYRVPKIGWRAGLALLQAQLDLAAVDAPGVMQRLSIAPDAVERSVVEQVRDAIQRALDLFPSLVEPLNPLRRVLWRWRAKRHNPFQTMTLSEVAVLLGFFSVCRMKRPDLRLGGVSSLAEPGSASPGPDRMSLLP